MRFFLSGLLILPCLSIISCQEHTFPTDKHSHKLVFDHLPTSWDEGIPLGNGVLGALIWEKEGHLRFSLDRIDLWDLRPMKGLDLETYNFKWVEQQWTNNTYEEVQKRLDYPYDREAGPTKIPGAALEFDLRAFGEIQTAELDVQQALCRIEWKHGMRLESFVHANEPIGWIHLFNAPKGMVPELLPPVYQDSAQTADPDNPVAGQSLLRLGYQQGKLIQESNSIQYIQDGWGGFQYQVHVSWKRSGKDWIGMWSISSHHPDQIKQESATKLVDLKSRAGLESSLTTHLDWWERFWNRSSIHLPDSLLEQQWYLEMYKFGSVARAHTPPISLQAIWTADNGRIPPWKGDLHHDLNTQMSYWPAYSSNHLDLEVGFVNWLWDHRETFKAYTRAYFGTDGLNVPGVTTQAGNPMGGWIQYALGPTVSAWLGQYFYWHWRYSKDRSFLETRTYPWIADVATYLDDLSVKKSDGSRTLPLSSSPEIYNNSRQAWFGDLTNFDLALIRWTFTTATELAQELGKEEEASKWQQILDEWPSYTVDEGGLLFAPGLPYDESHRHFSHLLAIHPLGLIDVSHGESDRSIIHNTISTLDQYGSDAWTGYSYSWLGNVKARALDGNGAAEALRIFAEAFCLPNSFHVNGDQSGKGYSTYTYRPFTLEGNFAFAAGIQEMLLQSHTGTLHIFPAIPSDWLDVSFQHLRAEGAFLISAKQQGGKLASVEIFAEQGGELRMKNTFSEGAFHTNISHVKKESDLIELELQAGGRVVLTQP